MPAIAWQAIAESGVFSDGFQMIVSPQTSASIAFQAQTATGKLKAVITPTVPADATARSAMLRPFAGDRQTIKLPAQADGEIANIDHLLDFAAGFAADLAGFAA